MTLNEQWEGGCGNRHNRGDTVGVVEYCFGKGGKGYGSACNSVVHNL